MMLKTKMPWKVWLFMLMSSVLLATGCAPSTEQIAHEAAVSLAKKQVQNISQNLPVSAGGYTLVLAQSSGATIKMTFLSGAVDMTTQSPGLFFQSFQKEMCADPAVKTVLTEGVDYSITINEARSGSHYQHKLNATNCGVVKKLPTAV